MAAVTKNKIGLLKAAIFSAVIAAVTFPSEGEAVSSREAVREGNHLYGEGKFPDSLRLYEEVLKKDPGSDIAHFNAGAALYKQKRYDEAADHFQRSLLSDDAAARERAHYNLGNSFYKAGIGKEKADIAAAIASLEESLKHFAGALALDKQDKDAQYNYDFVNKELERLRKEQQKQQQQSQQNQDGQEDQGRQQDQQHGQEQSDNNREEQQKQSAAQQETGKQENSSQSQSSSIDESSRQGASGAKPEGENQASSAQGQQQRAATSGTIAQGQELTKSEAERLLQNYQQSEEPRGLLHVFEQKHETGAVIKDW